MSSIYPPWVPAVILILPAPTVNGKAALTEALSALDWRVRWEAAKALTEIASPAAVNGLVAAMEDERPGVRWVASEGVIALGPRGVVPLLRALIRKADSAWFRLGAHHVLRAMEDHGVDERIQPVLAALYGFEPSVQVPLAAEEALDILREGPQSLVSCSPRLTAHAMGTVSPVPIATAQEIAPP